MRNFCMGAFAVLLLAPVTWAQQKEPGEQEPQRAETAQQEVLSPAQQYSQLLLEHRTAMSAFMGEYQKAKTDEERQKLMRDAYPQPAAYAAKFLQLADQNPDDPVADQARGWVLSNASGTPEAEKVAQILLDRAAGDPTGAGALENLVLIATRVRGEVGEQAAKLILQQAAQNPQDPRVLSSLIGLASVPAAPASQEAAKTLLDVAAANKEDPAIFDALASLVSRGRGEIVEKATRFLIDNHIDNDKLGMVCLRMMYSQSPEARELLREVIDKSYNDSVKGPASYALAKMKMRGGSEANKEVEELLESVVTNYADVEVGRAKLGQMAEGDLFELRNLQIGMIAPEIEGHDVDGQAFKLSEYKGKVVVLDFWGDW